MEAESGGRTDAQGDVGFGQGGGQYVGSEGIWQIFGQAHPQVTLACAQDPACATDAARQISSNWTNWQPWSTFNSGAYRRYLQGNVPAEAPSLLASVNPVQVAEDLGGRLGAVWGALTSSDPRSALSQETASLKDLGARGGLIVLGAALCLVGVVILFRPTAEAAVGVVTGGKFQRLAR